MKFQAEMAITELSKHEHLKDLADLANGALFQEDESETQQKGISFYPDKQSQGDKSSRKEFSDQEPISNQDSSPDEVSSQETEHRNSEITPIEQTPKISDKELVSKIIDDKMNNLMSNFGMDNLMKLPDIPDVPSPSKK